MKREDTTRKYLTTFVKTSLFVFFSIVLSKLFTYAYKIVVARSFGAEAYGNFSLAVIITGFFIAFASLGFSDGLVRYISYYLGRNDKSHIKYFVSIAMRVMLVSGIVGGLLLFILADEIALGFFRNAQLAVFLKAFSIIVPLSILGSVFIAFLRSYERAKTASFLVSIFNNGMRLALIAILIFFGFGLGALFYSYILSYAILILAALYFAKNRIRAVWNTPPLKKIEKRNLLNELFSYSWPLMFTGLLLSLFYWTDSIILGHFMSSEVVGFYNAAITLAGLFVMAPDLFNQLFLPIISKELSRKNVPIIRSITKQIVTWICMLNIPLFAVMIVFPSALLNLFFGSAFVIAQTPLRILAIGGLFSGFLNIFTNLLSAKKETKLILYNFLFFAGVNVVLGVMLITYSMVGVALATTISWIGFSITLFTQIKKNYGFYPVKRIIVRIGLAGLVPLAIMIVMSVLWGQTLVTMIVSVAVFCTLYVWLLINTKSLDEEDWEIVRRIQAKLLQSKPSFLRPREEV